MSTQKARLVIGEHALHVGFGHDKPIQIEFDRGDWVFMNADVGQVRLLDNGQEFEPLWVTGDEEAILIKMIDYILSRVRITPESEAALRRLHARLTARPEGEEEVVAADPGGGT